MEFSVLMSVYKNDVPSHLLRALESVTLEQTCKPTQVVLVKDGPLTEELENTIEQFGNALSSDIEWTVISQKENRGLAAALNVGLSACKFDLIARMDADDVSLPHRFASQILYMTQNPNISLLGGWIDEFESNEDQTEGRRVVPENHDEILKLMKTRNPVNHMSVVYRKSDVVKAGGYSEDFGKLEDYKLWVDMATNGCQFHNLQEILIHARIGNGFITRRSNKREIYDWDMLQKYLKNANMISSFGAVKNKLYIRIFIYTPAFLKKFIYKAILRK